MSVAGLECIVHHAPTSKMAKCAWMIFFLLVLTFSTHRLMQSSFRTKRPHFFVCLNALENDLAMIHQQLKQFVSKGFQVNLLLLID